MSRYGKPDKVQQEILVALRKAGAKVRITTVLGNGFPDLIVLYRGTLFLMEVKSPGGKLRPDQELFANEWHEATVLVRSSEDALKIIGAMDG